MNALAWLNALVWLNYSCLVELLLLGCIALVWLNYSCLVELLLYGFFFVWLNYSHLDGIFFLGLNACLFDFSGLVVMLDCLITLVWL